MKTPDEIKKGLECCVNDMEPGDECEGCPYFEKPSRFHWICRDDKVWSDAIALIQQLEADVESLRKFGENLSARNEELHGKIIDLEAERDAAVRDLKVLCGCMACDHAEKGPDSTPCNECTNCNGMVVESKWQWHGVQKEE